MNDAERLPIVARALAAMAVVLWLLSLSQPTLIVDNGTGRPNIMSGLDLLGMGWMGFGLFTAGWYANLPFFIAAIFLLFGKKAPWKIAIFGLLLALDTFRLQNLPGGGRGNVYGYGLGVALWFAAFGFMLLAAVWRSADPRGHTAGAAPLRSPAVLSVLALLVGATVLYGINAYRASQHSSVTESEFLPPGSVKTTAVCTESIAVPKTRIALNGPLEVTGRAYPLDAPATLLGWGIPVVRMGGFDFALDDPADISTIYWKPAAGTAAAILKLSSKHSGDMIEAMLTSADGTTTAFRQTWTRDSRYTSLYCPDYRPHDPAPSSAPRNLLGAAVDVPGGLRPPAGRLGNAISVTPVQRESMPNAKTHGTRDYAPSGALATNYNCPPHTGFVDKDPGAAYLGYGGQQTFAIGERRYFLVNNQPLAATCAGDSVYLYYFWLNNDQKPQRLYIQRRKLETFRGVWTTATSFDYPRALPFKGKPNVRIRALREENGTVTAEVADIEKSLIVDISFVAPAR